MNIATIRSIVSVLIVLSSALIATAQVGPRLIVHVPFEFYVNDTRLPAGKYEFFRSSELTNSTPLVVRSVNQRAIETVAAMVNPAENNEYKRDSVIVFNQYGDKHFLSGVYSHKARLGLRLLRGDEERSVATGDGLRPTRIALKQVKEKQSSN